jgi:hypothetical protein
MQKVFEMQNAEKRLYMKPVLEICGSMIERTRCEDEGTGSSCGQGNVNKYEKEKPKGRHHR